MSGSGSGSNNNGDASRDDRPQGSDKALLDRLNALKPTNISLGSSAVPAFTPASTIERAKPPSREDALSDRLKSLRNQVGSSEPEASPAAPSSPRRAEALSSSPVFYAQQLAPVIVYNAKLGASSEQGATTTPTKSGGSDTKSYKKGCSNNSDDDIDVDPLLSMTDDQTLEDLLADLESDQQWVEEIAAQEEDEQHKRAMALLKELSPSKGDKGREPEDGGSGDDSDDSDGEVMTREADDLIAKAMDEVELDKKTIPQEEQENDDPAQPAIRGQSLDSKNTNDADKSPLKLPKVPSDPSADRIDQDDTFAASMASRMAALKVSSPSRAPAPAPAQLPSVPSTEPDPFAAMLPSAPTFSPQDPKTKPAVVTGIVRKKRVGYTDEDQKSWCAVCLEDGTVRCLGCRDDGDEDVYCFRCWREMHAGPQAGYDETGHKWEKYVRDRGEVSP